MRAQDVIATKRDGRPLSEQQIRWFIDGYTSGSVADEQAAALAMAVVLNGMSDEELVAWTTAMIESGDRLDLGGLSRPTVDKHSTGGVGDKVSLVVVPLVAACGAAVPQMSGRGLGHTGGTLDKMEAIPHWRAHLSEAEILGALEDPGAVICGASDSFAPADRRLYALRDATATVESIPLIAASIISKKVVEGTDALVLEVTYGSGAFMPDPAAARELASTMVALGRRLGLRVSAALTRMDLMLGLTAGNAVEVAEAREILAGKGPPEVRTLCLEIATEMVRLAGLDVDPAPVLAQGGARSTFEAMVARQGGDLAAGLPTAGHVHVLDAVRDGWFAGIEARRAGLAAWQLGAGRARKEDDVSPVAGLVVRAVPGTWVSRGQPLVELHTDDPARIAPALDALRGAVRIDDAASAAIPRITEWIR